MYLSIKCRHFYIFGASQIQAELLKPVRFVFWLIIMVIPSMLCFPSFLTISYRFPLCFRMFPLVFLRFPRVFLLFPSVFPLFPNLDFTKYLFISYFVRDTCISVAHVSNRLIFDTFFLLSYFHFKMVSVMNRLYCHKKIVTYFANVLQNCWCSQRCC